MFISVYFVCFYFILHICCIILTLSCGLGAIEAKSLGPIFLRCIGTVGWATWPVKPVPDMTYNVCGGTLNLTQLKLSFPAAENIMVCVLLLIVDTLHCRYSTTLTNNGLDLCKRQYSLFSYFFCVLCTLLYTAVLSAEIQRKPDRTFWCGTHFCIIKRLQTASHPVLGEPIVILSEHIVLISHLLQYEAYVRCFGC